MIDRSLSLANYTLRIVLREGSYSILIPAIQLAMCNWQRAIASTAPLEFYNRQETGVYRPCGWPLIGRRRVCQRSRSLNVRAGAPFPPGEKTPQRERDSGPNQKRAA